MFYGVSAVSTRDAEGPGGCQSGVFVEEEVDGVGDIGSGAITTVDVMILQAWGLFVLTVVASVSDFRLKEFDSICVLMMLKW